MNEQIQTWAAIAGILGLLVGILSLLRDFFNLQWETSRSLIKRLLVDRRLWASIAILLVLTSLWSLYSQNSTLLQVIQQGEAEIAEIYKTQTAQPKYELTIEAILSAPTIIPRIIEATTVVKETSVVRETVIVEATPIVVATTAPATIQNTSPTPTTALPVPTSITGTLEVGEAIKQEGAEWKLLETSMRSNGIALQYQFTNRTNQELLLRFGPGDITVKDVEGNLLRIDEFRCREGIVCGKANDLIKSGGTFLIFFRAVFTPRCDGSQVIYVNTRNVSRIKESTWNVPIRC